jgi:hypothetical protein
MLAEGFLTAQTRRLFVDACEIEELLAAML